MTVVGENAIIQLNKKIEVAFFKSISSDVTGTDEEEGKGTTPKEEISCILNLGHAVKSRMTVICTTCCERHGVMIGWRTVRLVIDGALSRRYLSYIIRRRTFASVFFCVSFQKV